MLFFIYPLALFKAVKHIAHRYTHYRFICERGNKVGPKPVSPASWERAVVRGSKLNEFGFMLNEYKAVTPNGSN